MSNIVAVLGLYRLDVAVISFCAYMAGLAFSGGIDFPAGLITGAAVSLISFNYIYSLNSIEDRDIDRVNKPHRPLPAGRLSLELAQQYTSLLLVLSVVYPFFVRTTIIDLIALLTLPALGWAYSKPPLRLKTKAIPATVSIAIMYTLPLAAAFASRQGNITRAQFVLLGYIFLLCLSVVPLKDIEDVEGDALYDSKNFLALFGANRLFTFSASGLAVAIGLAILADLTPALTFVLAALPAAILSLILTFILFQLPYKRLYRSILGLIAILGLLFFINRLIFGGSL